MASLASLKAIQEAGSGVLFFGISNHLPNCLTIKDELIVQVDGGLNHSALVCKSGRVYATGNCTFKSNPDNALKKPKLVSNLARIQIVMAACGNRFTCFLSATGELFTSGVNDHGQLGTGDNVEQASPVRVNGIPKMKAVDAGESHAVAVTVDGQVWVAGNNAQGQLGLDHCMDQLSFTPVTGVHAIIAHVSCGSFHTALLAHSGVLYVTGSNKYGVLGLGDVSDVNTVQSVSLPSGVAIAAVACGHDHTVVLTVEGTVWTWGQNYYGQLGIGNLVEVNYTPIMMDGLEDYFITKVVAGPEHTALVTDEGNILVCGSGGEGELGYNDRHDIYIPKRLPLYHSGQLILEQVVCVYNATLVLLQGRNVASAAVTHLEVPPKVPIEVEPPSVPITDWEKKIMATLECPICFKIMSAPIHQCTKGHNFCNSCHMRNETRKCCMCRERFVGTRNMALEGLSDTLQLPCGDCLVRMAVPLLDDHSKVCPKRVFGCPLTAECGWTGKPDDILPHARSRHRYQVWERLPRIVNHYIEAGVLSNLVAAHGHSFMLYRTFDTPTNSFRAVAKFVGVLNPGEMYQLTMDFFTRAKKGTERHLCFNQDVCVHTEDVQEMLISNNAIVLKRHNFSIFFKHNQVSCSTAIVLKQGA